MAGETDPEPLQEIDLDRSGPVTLQRQLYEGMRSLILAGRLAAGTRLPSTRRAASALSLSRNTVLAAFERLALEGYLESRPGSGTFVARAAAAVPSAPRASQAPTVLSSYGRRAARGRTARDQDGAGVLP